MVYKFGYSNNTDLVGYIDSSLSEFDTNDYGKDMGKENKNGTIDPPVCQYRGYRKSFKEDDKYALSPQYWHVFAARLAFVVVFEHIVFALTGIMAYAIPDVPSEVRTQIQREKLLEKEEKYESGLRHQDDERSKGRDPLAVLREASSTANTGRGWWGRRLSKISDNLHLDRRRSSMTSTVLEEET